MYCVCAATAHAISIAISLTILASDLNNKIDTLSILERLCPSSWPNGWIAATRRWMRCAGCQRFRCASSISPTATHFRAASYLAPIGAYGWLGVDVFFVISGFIVPYAMLRAGYTLSAWPTFILKRLIRVEPPYLDLDRHRHVAGYRLDHGARLSRSADRLDPSTDRRSPGLSQHISRFAVAQPGVLVAGHRVSILCPHRIGDARASRGATRCAAGGDCQHDRAADGPAASECCNNRSRPAVLRCRPAHLPAHSGASSSRSILGCARGNRSHSSRHAGMG